MQFGYYNDFQNMPEQRSGTPVVQSTTLGIRNELNQNLRTSSHINMSAAPRSFGLQSRISAFNRNMKMSQDVEEMNRNNMSVFSRTFGLISDDLGPSTQSNERLHQESRRNDYSVNRSVTLRPFGLQTRNLTSFSHLMPEENLRGNEHSDFINYRRSNVNISSVSRTLDLRSENLGGLNSYDERLSHDLRQNNYVNSSLMLRTGGLPSRNAILNSGLLSDSGLRLNQDSVHRNNALLTSKTFGPAPRSSELPAGVQRQDCKSYTNGIFDDGFKRPIMSRVIRGRNSTLSSRLVHSESTERDCKDWSNVNGFNVSHISQRNVDSLSRSRFALNMQGNCTDNQSISQSVLSGASVKAQLMNLLENLHYSILNMGPHMTAEAVRLEFDKAKQSLENISEMSYVPSIWNGDAASVTSVISQSSKTICPTVNQAKASSTLDGGLLHLKSSKELLQSLISSKESGNKNSTSAQKGGRSILMRSSHSKHSDDEECSELVFKKARAHPRRGKTSRVTKVEASRRVKGSASKAASKAINLKQWYPIAVGSDLAFCGLDEQGSTVRTDAVKKRVNNRKIELMSGVACNLIGSPSAMVSMLPKKLITLLKNGLTDRWRILQKELLNCQTAEKDTKKRKSNSPKVRSSPKKIRGKAQTPKITSAPAEEASETQTRSGRTVKPPRMFWLVRDTGSNKVSSTSARATPETLPEGEEQTNKKPRKSVEETPVKKMKNVASERSKASRDASRGRKKSPRDQPQSKPSRAKGNKKKEREEEVKVHSSTEQGMRENKNRQPRSKRKREAAGDADAVEPKKSKVEKKTEEINESSVKVKEKKSRPAASTHSPKSKGKKLTPAKKKRGPIKKKTSENKKETGEMTESEEDFEMKLDDIEIPEIGNVSGNPQLNRSQLRLISMETPPLKYFSNSLKILRSATPVRSPDWCISQRTESEVKQFQRRREEALKKKIKVDIKKSVITEKSKGVQSKNVKRMMEWVAEKAVASPRWNSEVLQYVLPSRKRMEQQADEEDEEDIETEFL